MNTRGTSSTFSSRRTAKVKPSAVHATNATESEQPVGRAGATRAPDPRLRQQAEARELHEVHGVGHEAPPQVVVEVGHRDQGEGWHEQERSREPQQPEVGVGQHRRRVVLGARIPAQPHPRPQQQERRRTHRAEQDHALERVVVEPPSGEQAPAQRAHRGECWQRQQLRAPERACSLRCEKIGGRPQEEPHHQPHRSDRGQRSVQRTQPPPPRRSLERHRGEEEHRQRQHQRAHPARDRAVLGGVREQRTQRQVERHRAQRHREEHVQAPQRHAHRHVAEQHRGHRERRDQRHHEEHAEPRAEEHPRGHAPGPQPAHRRQLERPAAHLLVQLGGQRHGDHQHDHQREARPDHPSTRRAPPPGRRRAARAPRRGTRAPTRAG